MNDIEMMQIARKQREAQAEKQARELEDIDLEFFNYKKTGAPYSASRRRELGSIIGGFEL